LFQQFFFKNKIEIYLFIYLFLFIWFACVNLATKIWEKIHNLSTPFFHQWTGFVACDNHQIRIEINTKFEIT
jgi:hypothetical protein